MPSEFRINLSWRAPANLGSAFKGDLDYKLQYCRLVSYQVKEFEFRNVSVADSAAENTDGSDNKDVDQSLTNNIDNDSNRGGARPPSSRTTGDQFAERMIVLKKFTVTKTKYRKEKCKQLVTGWVYAAILELFFEIRKVESNLHSL